MALAPMQCLQFADDKLHIGLGDQTGQHLHFQLFDVAGLRETDKKAFEERLEQVLHVWRKWKCDKLI
jgi:hypothetical protein